MNINLSRQHDTSQHNDFILNKSTIKDQQTKMSTWQKREQRISKLKQQIVNLTDRAIKKGGQAMQSKKLMTTLKIQVALLKIQGSITQKTTLVKRLENALLFSDFKQFCKQLFIKPKTTRQIVKNIAKSLVKGVIANVESDDDDEIIESKPFEDLVSEGQQIVDILCSETDQTCAVIAGNKKRNFQKSKFQKRQKALRETAQLLKSKGIKADIIGNELVILTKQQKLTNFGASKNTKQLDGSEMFNPERFKVLERQLINKIKIVQKFSNSLQTQELQKRGFIQQIQINKGNQIINIDANNDAFDIAREMMTNPLLYQDQQSSNEMTMAISYTSSNIGGNKQTELLKNYLIISPNTVSRCVSDSMAIIEYVTKGKQAISIFAHIKQRSEQIAQKYNLIGGAEYNDFALLQEDFDFVIYQIGDEIKQAGIIVVQQHCVVALPNNLENQMIAEQLQKQYFKQQDKIITVNKKRLLEKPKNKRDIVYITYDFEWTYDKNQIEDLQCKKVDQFPYAYSMYVFLTSDPKLNISEFQPEYNFGLDSCQLFVERLFQITEQFPDHDFVLYAHNGQKADYPLIEKLLPRYYQKSFTNFASQMSVIAYRWNNKEQIVQFQDTMNLFSGMSLEVVGNTYGCDSQKLECEHDKIFLHNWREQVKEQKLEGYVVNDVVVLAQALVKYSEIIENRYGFPLLGHNNILSNSSLAQSVLLNNYYDPEQLPIYMIPDDFYQACKESYHGGSVQLFYKGYIKNSKIFAIDINSSYPAQMVKKLFPLGSYYKLEFNNQLFQGQQIPMGVYRIFIRDSPNTDYPVFFTVVDGVSQPSKIKNTYLWVTSAELEYAYSVGYTQIQIVQAIVSRNIGNPFKKFIEDHYKQRLENKKMMKQFEEGSEQYCVYNASQLLDKNCMNSSYGKFALANSRAMNELTSNENLIIDMLKKGSLTSYEKINNIEGELQFYQVGGISEQKGGKTNMMIASFITAYGRIQLNKIQRDIAKVGFLPIYSDTDSVYFMVNNQLKQTNKEINRQMKMLYDIHCDAVEIGKCKFETADDVGNCLPIYNQNIAEGDEPLEYAFADEAVLLALKSYALRSTLTGKSLLKGKGIPEYMVYNTKENQKIEDSMLKRCRWNNNDRQFVFEDFVKCALENKPFKFSVTQFMVQKTNITKVDKEHMKDGMKMNKNVTMNYKQKIVNSKGKCVTKVFNQFQECNLPQSYTQFEDEDYLIFNNCEEIKQHFELRNDEQWNEFKSKVNIIRQGVVNKFFVFSSFEKYKEFFEQTISIQETRDFHQLNSKLNQQLAFDIDIKEDQFEYLQDAEIAVDEPTIENDLRAMFNIPEYVKCEIINRSRKEKLSFHIRFNINMNYNTMVTMLRCNELKTSILEFVDMGIYCSSLRITSISSDFIFNPLSMPYQPQMNKKQVGCLAKLENNRTEDHTKSTKYVKTQQDKLLVADILKKLKIDNMFTYRDTQEGFAKGSKQIRLFHIKNTKYSCPNCKTIHTNDNCIFVEIGFDNTTHKEYQVVKCYKHLKNQKDSKLSQSKHEAKPKVKVTVRTK